MSNKEKTKMSLWSKIWKSLAALAIVYGLLSITGLTIKFDLWIFVLVAVIFFAVYWHLLEQLKDKIDFIKKYFLELQKDIKYIKTKIDNK
ncbi:MAG: hypothetical protein Q7R76_03430 [Candidatus Woesearchaeota archaeon]|nr:hypothetical protein [Candidatus Woesearchaeota archaeon]